MGFALEGFLSCPRQDAFQHAGRTAAMGPYEMPGGIDLDPPKFGYAHNY
jgi:hypothetical protein